MKKEYGDQFMHSNDTKIEHEDQLKLLHAFNEISNIFIICNLLL